ncbi:MAG: cytoskeleton protein RodZ [Halieaceae bacterium]|jgi:cytoskeleton protein RodZ
MPAPENSPTVSVTSASPGVILRAAREKAGLSRVQLAEKLNWVNYFVEAVEEDCYDVFSSRAFATGYVRSYGRYLEVPEESYLDAHRELLAACSVMMAREPLREIAPPRQVVSTSGYVGYLAGFAIAALAFFLWWQQADDEVSAAEVAAVTVDRNVDERSVAPAEITAEEVGAMAAVGYPDSAEVLESSEVGQPTSAPFGLASTDLHFSFSAECWLEVRDASGDVVFANLRKAGDVTTVVGTPPYEILIGDANAVTLHYAGIQVEIAAEQGRKFARLSVGA